MSIDNLLQNESRTQTLSGARKILIEYIYMKLEKQDWHAVSDAANDLRELDVELKQFASREFRPL